MFSKQEICVDDNSQLNCFPNLESEEFINKPIVIGDLHGNALKLIHLLIKHNRISLSTQEYTELYKIYYITYYYLSRLEYEHFQAKLITKTRDEATNEDMLQKLSDYVAKKKALLERNTQEYRNLTGKNLADLQGADVHVYINRFNTLLDNAKIKSRAPILVLGDDMRERGTADNYMVSVYEKLFINNIPYHTLFSNHGLKCIRDLESNKPLKKFAYPHHPHKRGFDHIRQYHSFNHMALLIKQGVLDETEIRQKLHQYWLHKMKLIHYSIEDDTITIFTHAPIGLKTITHMAASFGLNYCDRDLKSFAVTLDQIQMQFSELIQSRTVYQTSGFKMTKVSHGSFIPFDFPLLRTAWNCQDYEANDDVMPSSLNGFKIRWVHGHHRYSENNPVLPHAMSLDDMFGKDPEESQQTRSVTLRTGKSHLFFEEKIISKKLKSACERSDFHGPFGYNIQQK